MDKVAAGTTYVQMSREDIEGWLDEIGYRGKWKLQDGSAGVYVLKLSESVGIKFSSTVSSKDEAVSYANASMQLALISLVTGNVINKRAQGQDHFKRTKGWRQTWKDGLDRMKDAYLKAADFYNALASIKDMNKHITGNLNLIESIQGWENNTFLKDLHTRLNQGKFLTPRQEEAVKKFLAKPEVQPEDAPVVERKTELKKNVEEAVAVLRKLYAAARAANDQWTMDFTKSIADQVKADRHLSDKQANILMDKFSRYGVDGSLFRSWGEKQTVRWPIQVH